MVCPPWHVSRLAVASVNTHRTRWPTPTPTQTQSYIHLCTQMYNPPPPDRVAFLLPPTTTLPVSPSTPATRTPNFIIIISLARYPAFRLVREFCKSKAPLGPCHETLIYAGGWRFDSGKLSDRSIEPENRRLDRRGRTETRLKRRVLPVVDKCLNVLFSLLANLLNLEI